MPLTTIKIETASNPTASVIWMHGLGADGNDFVPIVKELDLSGCQPIRFVFPNAPQIPVSINGGYVMPAWYDIRNDNIEDDAGLRHSQKSIDELIANEQAQGIQKIILAGFSQGCAMTLQTGLRQNVQLAGLLCLSGYVPLYKKLPEERSLANKAIPIFMAHGHLDQVIPLLRAEQSRDYLRQLGYAVEWHAYEMGHTVSIEEIADISAWFKRILISK